MRTRFEVGINKHLEVRKKNSSAAMLRAVYRTHAKQRWER